MQSQSLLQFQNLELKIQEHETIERVLNEAQKESLKQQVSDLRNRFQELKNFQRSIPKKNIGMIWINWGKN